MAWPWMPTLMAPELAMRPNGRHGTRSRYSRGCRCDICRTMHAILHRRAEYASPLAPIHQKRAHAAVVQAVRDGLLVAPDECEECSARPRRKANGKRAIEAHHDDYTKPLEVRWLCKPCHSVADRANRSRRPLHSGEGAGASDERKVLA